MKKIFTLSIVAVLAVGAACAQGYRKWDFTHWGSNTVANLMADPGWSDIEKANATEPTEQSKDNCFWEVTASGTADGVTLLANNTVISELEGLLYTNTTNRSLAIAVNYPDVTAVNGTGFGPYHGPSYLWMGGSKKNYFVIPHVAPGTIIKMGVESHKLTDARGVNLYLGHGTNGTQLLAPDGSSVAAPKEYTEQEWIVPTDAADTPNDDGTYDIQIYNTNGCHLYYIEVGDDSKKASVAYLYNGDAGSDLGYAYIAGGADTYDVEPINATGALSMETLTAYDAIVISSTVTNADAISLLQQLHPFVPTLNLNPALYETWGYGNIVEAGTPFVAVKNPNHALFRDLTLIEDPDNPGSFALELTGDTYQAVNLQGRFANDLVLGTVWGVDEQVAIHAHNMSHNGYLFIPYNQEALASAATPQILVNAVKVLAATKAKVTQAPKPVIALDYKNLLTTVTLKSTVAGAQVFYTIDGTEPTTQSTLYTDPFDITTEGVTVKAIALGDGYLQSDVAEQAIDLKQQVETPGIVLEQADGYTIVTFMTTDLGYPGDLNIYYNYTGTKSKANSTLYTEPIRVSITGRTIYAFCSTEGYVDSELASMDVPIQNPKVRIDILAHMDANSAEYNGGSTSTAYYFSWGKQKGEYPYFMIDDYTETTTTDPETGEETTTKFYNTTNSEEEKNFENGWMIRSRGQIVDWENLSTGNNFGDTSGYNAATADDVNPDFPFTKCAIVLADKNTTPNDGQTFPYNAYIVTTQTFKGPFDVVANVASITKPDAGAKHQVVLEVATDSFVWEGHWQTLGDTINVEGARLTHNVVRSYEGTDEVYVRAYLSANNSKAGFYDIYIANEGELSKQRLAELSGIEEVERSTTGTQLIYDLQGRRLNGKPAHGLYIQNGRKYLAK